MIAAAIAVCASLTLLTVFTAFGASRADVVRRIAALDASAGRSTDHHRFVDRLIGVRDRNRLQQRFVEAGWYRMTLTRFVVTTLLGGLTGCVAGIVALGALNVTGIPAFAGAALLALGGLLLQHALLDRAVAARKLAVARTLPDWLDIVSTTVEAGTALNGALAVAVDAVRGPLADELREVLADVRLGRSRADALTAMAGRVRQIDLSATVTAIVQTERLGGDIAQLLDELAAEARNRRLMRAEELAAQLPVKMVVPMALFMLPALFVMIFGPVVADLTTRLK